MDCSSCPVRGVALYRSAAPDQWDLLNKARIGAASFKKGQLIMADQRESRFAYTITEGWAFSFTLLKDGRRQILDYYTMGDFLTLSTLGQQGIRASVRSLTAVKACKFEVSTLHKLLCSNHHFNPGVLDYISEKKSLCDSRLTTLGALNAEEAIAVLILTFVSRAGVKPEGEEPALFPLRLAEIADAVGITEIHAGRIIRRLEGLGAIERLGTRGFRVDAGRLRHVAQEADAILFEG